MAKAQPSATFAAIWVAVTSNMGARHGNVQGETMVRAELFLVAPP